MLILPADPISVLVFIVIHWSAEAVKGSCIDVRMLEFDFEAFFLYHPPYDL